MTRSKTDELAADLCEMEASEAEAQGYDGFPGWDESSEDRRNMFRAKVRDKLKTP